MKLRWTRGRRGGVPGSWTWDHLMFWDLIDDDADAHWYPEGVTVGWVKRERRDDEPDTYLAYPNEAYDAPMTHNTLDKAKAALVGWYVAKQLEEMQ